MSDTLDITSTACVSQNSAKVISERYGCTYELHSEISGVQVWKRIYNGQFSRARGDAWLAGHIGFKSLGAIRAYFASIA